MFRRFGWTVLATACLAVLSLPVDGRTQPLSAEENPVVAGVAVASASAASSSADSSAGAPSHTVDIPTLPIVEPLEPVTLDALSPEPDSNTDAAEAADAPEPLDFTVPVKRTPKIDRHVQFFSSRIRDRFEIWLNRLERHRPMVEGIFAEFNLPADLVFLSLVESGFNTNAVSRAKAVGPWQFIKPTAIAYGLRVDNWIDERRDPVKSTLAAAQYLRDLYQLFGSWPLAMAAYNAGERKVGRALVRARADDFWDLTDTKLLKRETKEYVPRFLAASLIAKDPERFGFAVSAPTLFQYEEVVLNRPVHLRTAARAAGMTYEELKALNPELRKDMTPPYPAYHLKIPVGSRSAFLANLGAAEDAKRIQTVQYQIRRGDTWARLAAQHGTTVAAILETNALSKSDKPKPGEWLLLPQTKKSPAGTTRALAKISRK